MHSLDPTYPLFPIFSFLGFMACAIPLPWHIHAWNAGTCAFMFWTGIVCFVGFVNSIAWAGTIDNFAPVWCDISTQIITGASVGIPAATLCISRRLYCITTIQVVSVTPSDKRRALICDLAISVGIPILVLLFHIVVQPHRFDILQDIGCYPVTYNTLPAYFLYFMWPGVLGVISFVYSALNLRSFWRRRIQFSQFISSSTPMSVSRYLRLMTLSVVDMMFTVPLSIFTIYSGTNGIPLAPWISWSDTHFNFGRVALFPTIIWRNDRSFLISVELTRWLPIFCAFLFFGLFGFAAEAQKHYRIAFWWVAKRFGYLPPAKGSSKGSVPSWKQMKLDSSALRSPPPAYTPQRSPTTPKRRPDSFVSSIADNDVELGPYRSLDAKSVGMSFPSPSTSSTVPPEYLHHHDDTYEIDVSSPSWTFHSLAEAESSRRSLNRTPSEDHVSISDAFPASTVISAEAGRPDRSLRARDSRDRVYVSDAFHQSPTTRPPSPAPFTDVTIPDYHRPFTPPSVYPVVRPHPGQQGITETIMVTVHSESTDKL